MGSFQLPVLEDSYIRRLKIRFCYSHVKRVQSWKESLFGWSLDWLFWCLNSWSSRMKYFHFFFLPSFVHNCLHLWPQMVASIPDDSSIMVFLNFGNSTTPFPMPLTPTSLSPPTFTVSSWVLSLLLLPIYRYWPRIYTYAFSSFPNISLKAVIHSSSYLYHRTQKISGTFKECLLWDRYFAYIISFNFQNKQWISVQFSRSVMSNSATP